jgi:hypothetical protein
VSTDQLVVVASPKDTFVELGSAPGGIGKLYRKQLLRYGTFPHPSDPTKKLVIDNALVDSVMTNFANGVCDIVQVPLVNDKNQHVEDPMRNIGEVIDLEKTDKGLFAVIDARKEDAAKELGRTLLGASAMMHLNYTDTHTGAKVGPTLLHAAITNRPFITNLDGFEEVIAASADIPGNDQPVLFGEREEEEVTMGATKEELIAALREEHGIDVEELESQVTALSATADENDGPTVEDIAKQIVRTVSAAGVELSGGGGNEEDLDIRDVAEAVIELAREKSDMEVRVTELVNERDAQVALAAQVDVEAKIASGHILPTQKDAMVKLARTDPDTYKALVPQAPIVDMTEDGVTVTDATTTMSAEAEQEIARLSAMANGSTPE